MNIPDDPFFTLLSRSLQMRGKETLQRSLYAALREAIMQGQLKAQSWLPGSRVIAERLQISRNTVNAALEQLAMEGYLRRDRQGSRVASLPQSVSIDGAVLERVTLPSRLQRLPQISPRDTPPLLFTPGTPAINYFPLPLWRRLLDRVLRTVAPLLRLRACGGEELLETGEGILEVLWRRTRPGPLGP